MFFDARLGGLKSGLRTSAASVAGSLTSTVDFGKVVNVFDVQGGYQWRLWSKKSGDIENASTTVASRVNSFSSIAGTGFLLPDTKDQPPSIFRIPKPNTSPGFDKAFGAVRETIDNSKGRIDRVALVARESDEFFRRFFLGVTFESFKIKNQESATKYPDYIRVLLAATDEQQDPTRLEASVERAVTAQVRVEGAITLPWESLEFVTVTGIIRFFPGKPRLRTPLILTEAPTRHDKRITLPDPKVLVIPFDGFPRDSIQVGIGFNLVEGLRRVLKK